MAVIFAFGLLALPRLRDIDITALITLIFSALCLLALAWREWAEGKGDGAQIEFSGLAIVCTAVALLSVGALITVPRMFVGVGDPRHWSAASYLFVCLGLIWGVAIGQSARKLGDAWRAGLQAACGLVVAFVYASIVMSQIAALPDLMTYAREWDERHELLLELSAAGERNVVIPPREFDLVDYALRGEKLADTFDTSFYDRKVLEYYDMDSITLEAGG